MRRLMRCIAICCACGGRRRRFREQRLGQFDGAVLGPDAFLLRYFGPAGDDRLLLVNLGKMQHLRPRAGTVARGAARQALGHLVEQRAAKIRRPGTRSNQRRKRNGGCRRNRQSYSMRWMPTLVSIHPGPQHLRDAPRLRDAPARLMRLVCIEHLR